MSAGSAAISSQLRLANGATAASDCGSTWLGSCCNRACAASQAGPSLALTASSFFALSAAEAATDGLTEAEALADAEALGDELALADALALGLAEPLALALALALAVGLALALVALARSEEHTSELQSRPHLVCR